MEQTDFFPVTQVAVSSSVPFCNRDVRCLFPLHQLG